MSDSSSLVSLTLREAIDLTKRAIRAKGWDYVYPSWEEQNCLNFEEDGSPSCVVGHVLSYRGVTLQGLKLKDAEWNCTYNYYNQSGITSMRGEVVDVDDETEVFLNALQMSQDSGFTWGNAYITALRELYSYRNGMGVGK